MTINVQDEAGDMLKLELAILFDNLELYFMIVKPCWLRKTEYVLFEATLGRFSFASSIRPTDMDTCNGRPRVRRPRIRSPVTLLTEAETIEVPKVFISDGDLQKINHFSKISRTNLLEVVSIIIAPAAPSFVASLIFS